MNKWLSVIQTWAEIPEIIKDAVENASDAAEHLALDKLGLAEIIDGDESYYVIKKDDFEEWFGD